MMKWDIEMVSKNESDVAIPNKLCINRATGSCEIHTHEFLEVVYVYCGSNTQIINGVSYEAKKGDVFFINIGDTHAYNGSNFCVLINFIFMPGVVSDQICSKDRLLLPPFVRFSEEDRKRIEDVVLTIEIENNRKKFGYESIVKNYFAILIVLLKEAVCLCGEEKVRFELSGNNYDMLFKYKDLKNTAIKEVGENSVNYKHMGFEYGIKLSCGVQPEDNGYRISPDTDSFEISFFRLSGV